MAYNLAVCACCGKEIKDGQYYRDNLGDGFKNYCSKCHMMYMLDDGTPTDLEVVFSVPNAGEAYNDFELTYSPATKRYYLNTETTYQFDNPVDEENYYLNLKKHFEEWMTENYCKDITNSYRPLNLYNLFNRPYTGFNSIEEAYHWFCGVQYAWLI